MSETNKSIKGFHVRTFLKSIADGEFQPCSDTQKLAAKYLLPDTDNQAFLEEEQRAQLLKTIKKIADLSDILTVKSEREIQQIIDEWHGRMKTTRIDCGDCLSTDL